MAAENVKAVEDAPVETKNIPVVVVSRTIVVADEREKMNFSWPEEGATIVKFLDVDVAEENTDIP